MKTTRDNLTQAIPPGRDHGRIEQLRGPTPRPATRVKNGARGFASVAAGFLYVWFLAVVIACDFFRPQRFEEGSEV